MIQLKAPVVDTPPMGEEDVATAPAASAVEGEVPINSFEYYLATPETEAPLPLVSDLEATGGESLSDTTAGFGASPSADGDFGINLAAPGMCAR